MNIYFYPDLDAKSKTNKLSKRILVDFRSVNLKKWRPMFHFINIIKSRDRRYFLNLVQSELAKPHKKREVVKLEQDLYEYRGKQAKDGTIRVYFFIINENAYIVDAEIKTDDENLIERATNRMKTLRERMKNGESIKR
jgi:phage-related protein